MYLAENYELSPIETLDLNINKLFELIKTTTKDVTNILSLLDWLNSRNMDKEITRVVYDTYNKFLKLLEEQKEFSKQIISWVQKLWNLVANTSGTWYDSLCVEWVNK